MSDQARDDLVAAMEAWDAYCKASQPWDEDQSREHCYLACSAFIRKHGKHLLALLDAEPVAWRIDGLTPSHPIFTTNKQRADLPRQRGVTVTALYARPEASDE